MELGELIEKAALLHDIGKPVLRGFPGSGTHSQCGVEFLKPYVGETVEAKTVLRAVGHHHSSDLKGLSLNKDDITYIVYEADNLAAGTDRRANEDGTGGFCATMPLENVFNSFAGSGTAKTGFYLRGLLEEKRMLYPVNATDIQASSSEYKKIIETLKHNFVKKSPVDMTINELLRIMEGTMSYIPSSTAKNEVADISLYDHQRMTAAYAICMYRYFDDQNITDYRSMCYGKAYRELRNKDMYLLVSGDISGIQDFIYTIPSKGALKSLRGRSFYLELLLEHIADELLTAIHMSRSCLIYTGGGHFYMLLPNTQRMTAFLSDFATKMNDWFLQNFGSRLYIAMAWTPCSANEFIDETKGGAGNVFHRLSRLLSQKKLNRYDQSQLQLLISPKSEINNVPEGARECAVCHTSVPATELEQYEDDEENACQRCRNLLQLGKAMLDNNVIIISTKSDATALPLPGWEQEKYLCTAREEAVDSFPLPIERLYIKNQMYTGADLATYLWVGDYVSRGNQNNQVLDFEQLAMLSGGSIKNTGIKRLGVMRADIDNLGAAFIKGFSIHYDTLSRKSVLSRQLSLFFKRYINDICAGNVNGVNENQKTRFSLFGIEKESQRHVHIIYSGGDDMFLVGAWDDLIELAVDIRRDFAQFTNGKLTFSAGIGFFHHACPISQMARVTGELEDLAKAYPGKDSIMLFGTETNEGSIRGVLRNEPYSWNVFIHKVCEEKLSFWQAHFQQTEESDAKLNIGKSSIYRLMNLLDTPDGSTSINLARFAYVLGRMEPDKSHATQARMACYQEVRQQFYEWYKQTEDRRELQTAIQLVVYQLRESEG